MIEMNPIKAPEKTRYKVILVFIVALVAFSNAMKDLSRLQEVVGSVQEFTSHLSIDGLLSFNETTLAESESSCPSDASELSRTLAESGSIVRGALAGETDYEGIPDVRFAEPQVGGKVEVGATRKANRTGSRLAGLAHGPGSVRKGDTLARKYDRSWLDHREIRTVYRTLTLDLPVTVSTEIKAETLDVDRPLEVPLVVFDKIGRTQFHGRAGNLRRELIFKRLDGSTSLRRSS